MSKKRMWLQRLIVAAVVVLALLGPARAEWVFVTENNEGRTYYANTEGIERYPGYIRVWIRADYSEVLVGGIVGDISQWDFATGRASFRPPVYWRFHRVDGSLALRTDAGPKKWRQIGPGSGPIYAIWEAVHKW